MSSNGGDDWRAEPKYVQIFIYRHVYVSKRTGVGKILVSGLNKADVPLQGGRASSRSWGGVSEKNKCTEAA